MQDDLAAPKKDTKSKGDTSEAMVLARLIQAGFSVSLPFGENNRYDLISDDGKSLSRVQVKSGRLRRGAILFNTCSMHDHRGGPARHYNGAADQFGIYCSDTDEVYLVPVEDVPNRQGSLRVEATKNNQAQGVRMASLYLIKPA